VNQYHLLRSLFQGIVWLPHSQVHSSPIPVVPTPTAATLLPCSHLPQMHPARENAPMARYSVRSINHSIMEWDLRARITTVHRPLAHTTTKTMDQAQKSWGCNTSEPMGRLMQGRSLICNNFVMNGRLIHYIPAWRLFFSIWMESTGPAWALMNTFSNDLSFFSPTSKHQRLHISFGMFILRRKKSRTRPRRNFVFIRARLIEIMAAAFRVHYCYCNAFLKNKKAPRHYRWWRLLLLSFYFHFSVHIYLTRFWFLLVRRRALKMMKLLPRWPFTFLVGEWVAADGEVLWTFNLGWIDESGRNY